MMPRPPWSLRWLYAWLVGLALLPAIWLWLDPWTGAARETLRGHAATATFLEAIGPLGKADVQIPLLALPWLVAWLWVGWRRARRGFLLTLLCLLMTGVATNLMKVIVWRARPLSPHQGFFPRTWDNIASSDHLSFPSGDAGSVFAIATATMLFAPRVGILVFVIGLAIGASRIAAGMHHFADVWGALLLGTALPAWVLHALWRRESARAQPHEPPEASLPACAKP